MLGFFGVLWAAAVPATIVIVAAKTASDNVLLKWRISDPQIAATFGANYAAGSSRENCQRFYAAFPK